ncbi:MAG: UDP-N-acetylmuramate dehydrogenase [Deltaproteobacteria bacterium]|nr:UDP-N-acetylmuramate dehydrogenase [Deltaproteobacteria bacterium]MBW1952607.1 UDP-N-acetylmuramate dehydrogenase [Deltaproteobacteria bacterium]MBW1986266.1 UDP-N-acetylmuramate dehydrogenase [Deltaproteobacteria bacterium]MBW2134163.1 UDP-N-acetylmuramate dehydrogenase [Deltaproteobacteria bacterium]
MDIYPTQLQSIRGQLYVNHLLGPLTTWKIGGAAQVLAVPADLDDLFDIFRLAKTCQWPVFFLGRGSNLLIADRGLPGLTLHLARAFKEIKLDGNCLRVGAGVSLPTLAQYLAGQGVAGFEFLAGIPGTVGAAVRINAGTGPGQDISSRLRQVTVVTPRLQMLTLMASELEFGYRRSRLLNFPHWLVVAAEFYLTQSAPPEEIQARMTELLRQRRVKFPANPRNCGSVFKNPAVGRPAGWLIERAGLKGLRYGEAQVSTDHANFIINLGHATAAQVKALIAQIQETVWKAHGVSLEREMVMLPEDLLDPKEFLPPY